MKKLLLISALFSALTSQAFAETEGYYIGASVLHVNTDHEYNPTEGYASFDDNSVGFGVDYKYAFNHEGIFVAPSIFYDYLGAEAKDSEGDPTKSNYRYGARVDLGYDITNKFAAFISAGVAVVDYETNWASFGLSKSDSDSSGIYGAGVKFDLNNQISLNASYDYQELDFKTPSAIQETDTKISTFRVGAAYRF